MGVMPVPERATFVEGVVESFEVILRVLDLAPVDAGEKVAASVQFAPGAIVGVRDAQGFVPPVATLNIAASPPVRVIKLTTRSAVPALDIVKDCGVEELPTCILPKS